MTASSQCLHDKTPSPLGTRACTPAVPPRLASSEALSFHRRRHPYPLTRPAARLTLGLRSLLIGRSPIQRSARERTSVGFLRARLSVYGLASLAASPHLLLSVTAFEVSVVRIMPQKLPFVKRRTNSLKTAPFCVMIAPT